VQTLGIGFAEIAAQTRFWLAILFAAAVSAGLRRARTALKAAVWVVALETTTPGCLGTIFEFHAAILASFLLTKPAVIELHAARAFAFLASKRFRSRSSPPLAIVGTIFSLVQHFADTGPSRYPVAFTTWLVGGLMRVRTGVHNSSAGRAWAALGIS
jgi:hypothetical protein